jgi:hypothetical protein
MKNPWIGVDLDGTLAHYDPHDWRGEDHIGEPIPAMVERVKAWLAEGKEVRIFTARMSGDSRDDIRRFRIETLIGDWCKQHIGRRLRATNEKDYGMVELWDDRAVQVIPNTGTPVGR